MFTVDKTVHVIKLYVSGIELIFFIWQKLIPNHKLILLNIYKG